MGVCSPVQRQGDPPRRKMVFALNPSRAPWPMLAGPRYTEGPFGIPKIEGHFWCALAVVACATDEPIDISLTVSMHHGTNTILGGSGQVRRCQLSVCNPVSPGERVNFVTLRQGSIRIFTWSGPTG